jgi:hypothetical protein
MLTETMMQQPFEAEFARAWDAPGHTRCQLPDIDINQVLAARLTAVFEHMAASPWLAGHTEIYIRENLGIELTRNPG